MKEWLRNEYRPEEELSGQLVELVNAVDRRLIKDNLPFDRYLSGSTLNLLAFDLERQTAVSLNVGDSRGVFVNYNSQQLLIVTEEHNPDQEEEYARIMERGGRVHRLRQHGQGCGPFRVWVQQSD